MSSELPSADDWLRYGVHIVEEVHAGHQSRVLSGRHRGRDVVLKLTSAGAADVAFHQRLAMVAQLAERTPLVVGPLPVGDELVLTLGDWMAVAYPLVKGRGPDVTVHGDAVLMAQTLAQLHAALDGADGGGLPQVAMLRSTTEPQVGFGPERLLHGDYSAANVILTEHGVRIIDFDDAGRGPVVLEISNTLYMVLFDAAMSGRTRDYEQFRRWFVPAYVAASHTALDDALIDRGIALRVRALARWLDDLESAPIGIRNATPQWRARLRQFVDAYP